MNILFNRLVYLCKKTNIDFHDIERACGFSNNSIIKWETSTPLLDRIIKVANYFDVSIDYLVGNSNNPSSHKIPDIFDFENAEFMSNLDQLSVSSQKIKDFLMKHWDIREPK